MSRPEPEIDWTVEIANDQFHELMSVLRQICREIQELNQALGEPNKREDL